MTEVDDDIRHNFDMLKTGIFDHSVQESVAKTTGYNAPS